MRRLFILVTFWAIMPHPCSDWNRPTTPHDLLPEPPEAYRLFKEMKLEGIVNFSLFERALTGYYKLPKKRPVLTLIDYSKPSTEERLFVLDMDARQLLHRSLVAHGRNSGGLYATSFSNDYGSYKSSLGFFRTGNTYQGGNGYSLLLDGLEKGINDAARSRAIVIHGASYANPGVIGSAGRLGRSLGCPALPQSVSRNIIDEIKNGSLVFIYAENKEYNECSCLIGV